MDEPKWNCLSGDENTKSKEQTRTDSKCKIRNSKNKVLIVYKLLIIPTFFHKCDCNCKIENESQRYIRAEKRTKFALGSKTVLRSIWIMMTLWHFASPFTPKHREQRTRKKRLKQWTQIKQKKSLQQLLYSSSALSLRKTHSRICTTTNNLRNIRILLCTCRVRFSRLGRTHRFFPESTNLKCTRAALMR